MILEYDFRVVGAQRVNQALSGIERRVARHNQVIGREFGGSGRRTSGDPMRNARAGLDRVTRERARAEAHVFRVRQRHFMQVQREEERAEKASERRRIAAEKRIAREREKAAKIVARERESFRRRTVGTAAKSIRGSARAIGMGAAGALAIGGSFAATGAIQHQLDLRAASAELANQAYREGSGPSRQEIQRSVMTQAQAEGARSGLGSEGIVRGLRQFVAISGSLEAGQKLAPFMADIANASGADIGDVGRTGGQVAQALIQARGVSPEQAVEETKDILAAMAGQAKIGSIEFADLAQQMGKLISSTARFEGQTADLAATMGAVGQLAIAGGASSPEEAMTSILRFSDDIVQNAKKFKKLGVNVFTDKSNTQLQAPEKILFDMIEKSGGDLTKIKSVFGIRAMKAAEPFQKLFTESGGGQRGRLAIEQRLAEFKGTKMTAGEVRDSAAFRVGQDDRQFARVMEEFNQEIGSELIPVIRQLIPELKELIPPAAQVAAALARFAKFMLENPLQGIGQIIAAKVVMDIAAAQIGAKLSAVMMGQGSAAAAAGGMVPVGGAAATGGARAAGQRFARAGALGKTGMVGGGLLKVAGSVIGANYVKDEALGMLSMMDQNAGQDSREFSLSNFADDISSAISDTNSLGDFWENMNRAAGDKFNIADALGGKAKGMGVMSEEEAKATEERYRAKFDAAAEKQATAADSAKTAAAQMEAAAQKQLEAAGLLAGTSVPGASLNRSNSPTAPR